MSISTKSKLGFEKPAVDQQVMETSWKGFSAVLDVVTATSEVRGDYNIAGSNHNKPAYKKEQKAALCSWGCNKPL